MGIFDSLFGTGDSKTETKQQYDGVTTNAQRLQQAGAISAMTPYLTSPQAYVAPMSTGQQQVGTQANALAGYAGGTNYAGGLKDYAADYLRLGGMAGGDPNALAAFIGKSGAGGMDQFIPGYSQQAIDASTIGMDDIMGFANPYADAVMDNGMRRLDESYGASQADIGARAAAGGAFGGSGEAIRRSMLDEDRLNAVNDLSTQTMYDSYGMGANLAGQNAANRTSALMSAGNDVYSRAMGAAQYDANQASDVYGRALGSATYGDNTRNDSFNRQLSGLQGASGYGLSMAGANNGFANDYTSRNLQALGLLGGYGDLQRQVDQQGGDKNWTSFTRMASLVPGVQPTTSTTQPTNNTGLLGTALTAASLFA